MKRVGMFFVCGAAVLSLLFTFSVPAAHAQGAIADAFVQGKLNGNLKIHGPDGIETEKGKVKFPAIIREVAGGPNADGGFNYVILLLSDEFITPTDPCNEILVGGFTTFGSDEMTALGDFDVLSSDLPDELDADTELFGEFNANVKLNSDGEFRNMKSKGAWGELLETVTFGLLGITRKIKVNTIQKDFDKLQKQFELECSDPTAP